MAASRFAASLGACAAAAVRVPTPAGGRRAAIALVLRVNPATRAEEALFIKRASRAGDPWSGNVALPGGRQEPGDADDDEATAARECLEEVGLDVGDAGRWRPLGRVADDRVVVNGRRPLVLSIFAFDAVGDAGAAALAPQPSEVAHAWWVPCAAVAPENVAWRTLALEEAFQPLRRLPRLAAAGRAFGLKGVRFACVRLPPPGGAGAGADADAFALWGLTLACVSDARRRAGLAPLVGAGAAPEFASGFAAESRAGTAALRVGFAAARFAAARPRAARALALGAGAAAVAAAVAAGR